MALYSWCTSPYTNDIHKYYKAKEKLRRKIDFQSPQANSRIELVEWIRTISEKYKFSTLSVHLAVYILDQFMDTYGIAADKLGVVVLVCLVIATKFEDDEGRLPRTKKLLTLLPNQLTSEVNSKEVIQLERFVLHKLHWRLDSPTSATFAEYYRLFTVVNSDEDCHGTPHRVLKRLVESSFDTYLDRSLLCVDLFNMAPSHIAAACLLAARISNNVSPSWPITIETLTWCSYEMLAPIADYLLHVESYDSESGYSSSPEARSLRRSFIRRSTSP